jgi:hypothetical protein
MKKRVYIAGPISKGGLFENVARADIAFRELLRAGFAPLCPHWSVFHGSIFSAGRFVAAVADPFPGGTTHADWMGVDLPWVEASHAVLRLPGESAGADLEVAHAERHGIPVFDSIDAVLAWGAA